MNEKSVTINGIRLSDLGFFLVSFDIASPEVNAHYVEVPGRDGALDATEAIFGKPTYKMRTIVINVDAYEMRDGFEQNRSRLAELFHGRNVDVCFDADPTAVWSGRADVQGTRAFKTVSQYIITVTAQPRKRFELSPTADYLWDEINFDRDVLTNLRSIPLSSGTSKAIVLGAGLYPLTLYAESTVALTVRLKGKSTSVPAGVKTAIPGELINETATVTLSASASGTVNLSLRGECL